MILPQEYKIGKDFIEIKDFLPPVWPTVEDILSYLKSSKKICYWEFWLNIPVHPEVISFCSRKMGWKHARPWDMGHDTLNSIKNIFYHNKLYVDPPMKVGPNKNKLHFGAYFSTQHARLEDYIIGFTFNNDFGQLLNQLYPKYDLFLAPGSTNKFSEINDIWIHVPIPQKRRWAKTEAELSNPPKLKKIPECINGILQYIEKVVINKHNMTKDAYNYGNFEEQLREFVIYANDHYNSNIKLDIN